MSITEKVKTGAALISWDMFTYRTLLKKVLRAKKGATEKEVLEEFVSEVQKPGNKEFLHSALMYAAKNGYIAAMREIKVEDFAALKKLSVEEATSTITETVKESFSKPQMVKAQAKAEKTYAAVEILKEAAKETNRAIKLMSMIMPNGKTLGDNTVEEARLSTVSLYQALTGLPAYKKVSEVLTAQQLNELYDNFYKE